MLGDSNLNLMQAVISYDLGLIKELVENGADIHCENDFVFNISCGHNKPEIAKYVISLASGSDLEYYINEALVNFAHCGDIQFVQEMIDMGGDIHYKNNEAVNWCCGFGKIEMVKYLLRNGAVLDIEYASRIATQNNHKEIIDFLKKLES
jgi:ankyrin repeat protein